MKLPPQSMHRIGIFRALQLGDLLCAIPAIRTLRRVYPDAEIVLIGLPGMEDLVHRFRMYINELAPFPGYMGLPEQRYDPSQFEKFAAGMRNRNFNLILQMQGNGSIVNEMLKKFNSHYIAGFCETADEQTALQLPYPNYGHEATRHLALMNYLGIDTAEGPDLEFPIMEDDFQILSASAVKPLSGDYICLHPGSRGSWRQWPPLYFAAIADLCIDNGFQVAITGTTSELELAQQIANLMIHRPVILSGKTTVGEVAVLLSKARGLVCNCTGISHIAAALKVPSVVVSMDGEPERWAPMNEELHKTIDWTKNADYTLVANAVSSLFFDTK